MFLDAGVKLYRGGENGVDAVQSLELSGSKPDIAKMAPPQLLHLLFVLIIVAQGLEKEGPAMRNPEVLPARRCQTGPVPALAPAGLGDALVRFLWDSRTL